MFIAGLALPALAHADPTLFGILWDTGALYTIDPKNAGTAKVGDTNVKYMADIGLGPDGKLYGFSTGLTPAMYQIDPKTAATTKLADIKLEENEFMYEGALVFTGEGGQALATSILNGAKRSMFTIDFFNKTVSGRTELKGDATDINGWTDPTCGCGFLTGIDRESNSLVEVDATTGVVTKKKKITPIMGETGGMATLEFETYLATGGAAGAIPGSNALYKFVDSDTDPTRIGGFTGIGGKGFSGIAAPEPASMIALAVGVGALTLRRKARKENKP